MRCRIAAMPLSATALVLGACANSDARDPVAPPARLPAVLVAVAGDLQEGIVQQPLLSPFVVRVDDAAGAGLGEATVEWTVAAGQGVLCSPTPVACSGTTRSVTTSALGLAAVYLRPLAAGVVSVTAEVDGLAGSLASFTTDAAPGVLIAFSPLWECSIDDPVLFVRDAEEITLGMRVMFEYDPQLHSSCRAQVASTSVPADGEAFDTGLMPPGGRYLFTPRVAGTWHFIDRESAGVGSFIVVP